jgi:preprotein translocase subunit SecY
MNETEPEQPPSFASSTLDSLIRILPEVEAPRERVPLKKMLMWSGILLVIYFIMGEITIYGITQEAQDYFSFVKVVFASRIGTLTTLGIAPVVTAGIFMQLFQGAEIFHFDLTSHQGRAQFQGSQKLLAIFLCFFEAALYVFAGAFGQYRMGIQLFLILQIAFGAILIVLMDEVITKWGFGSGISLFIVGGVSRDIFWRLFSFERSAAYGGEFIGALPSFVESLIKGNPIWMRAQLPDIIQVLFTIIIFMVVIYFETLWVEVPLSLGRFRGVRGGYPLKFIYTSVIPVILTISVFGTYGFFIRTLNTRINTGFLGTFDSSGDAAGGIIYYLTPPRGLFNVLNEPLRALIYLVIVVVFCALFAVLWANIAGMDSKTTAKRFHGAGVQVAGFQRDIRVVETVLDRYIPPLIIMGGIAVGLLAALSDFTRALGTGTGILLAVSILYKMYLDLARHPELPEWLRGFFA